MFSVLKGDNNSGDSRVSRRVECNARWKGLAKGRIKINTDAWISNGDWIGLGMITRDEEGDIVGAEVKRINYITSPLVAEAMGQAFCL